MAVMDMERPETATSEKSDTAGKSAKAGAAPKDNAPDSKSVAVRRFDVATDSARDALLTDFGKETLKDRYLLPGESYQDLFARVASAYADDQDHAQRIYDYISRLWFMPATPVLSNGGTGRGLPISCYLKASMTALRASSTPGTRMSGSQAAAAASAPIGAMCAASASRSA
jgi:ribonucleoside-diphosphate reductase alpha chain